MSSEEKGFPRSLPVELWERISEELEKRPPREVPAIRKLFEVDEAGIEPQTTNGSGGD